MTLTTRTGQRNMRPSFSRRGRSDQSGFVMIAALIMLIILSILAISLYRNSAVQEHIAGNSREKGRAFQLAQSTLQAAEYQLVHGLTTFTQNASCSASNAPTTTPTICIGPATASSPIVVNPTATSPMVLANGWIYTPSALPSSSISTTPSNSTYYKSPMLQIRYLGTNGNEQLYQLTALAYGATPNTVAVVQSVFELESSVINVGNP